MYGPYIFKGYKYLESMSCYSEFCLGEVYDFDTDLQVLCGNWKSTGQRICFKPKVN